MTKRNPVPPGSNSNPNNNTVTSSGNGNTNKPLTTPCTADIGKYTTKQLTISVCDGAVIKK